MLLYSPSFRSLAPAFAFDTLEVTIGRDPASSIVLDDEAVSRRHARVAYEGGSWKLTDLGSRNGTFVDGARVQNVELEPLHEVRIGDALFKFVDADAREHARYRIDGTIDGAPRSVASALVGGHAMHKIEEELARVAKADLSCVVLGETGTGKEVFAREVHRVSGRPGAFQAIHCAAIPQGLLESELFGFRRGAFSGAQRDKEGLIQKAHGGTLFLDEIGDMPLEAQVKLLRVLQSREVVRLGGTQPEHVDLRVVCATHRDLYDLVREGRFRGDLFARLNEYATVLPPLRERKEDIFALTAEFLSRHSRRRLEPTFAFSMALFHYDWPFNVRELESAVKRAAALAEGGTVEARHLPPAVLEGSTPGTEAALERSRERAQSAAPPGAPEARRPRDDDLTGRTGEGFLRGAPTEGKLRELLGRRAGNVAAVARELGKGRMQVHRWMRRYGISIEEYRAR